MLHGLGDPCKPLLYPVQSFRQKYNIYSLYFGSLVSWTVIHAGYFLISNLATFYIPILLVVFTDALEIEWNKHWVYIKAPQALHALHTYFTLYSDLQVTGRPGTGAPGHMDSWVDHNPHTQQDLRLETLLFGSLVIIRRIVLSSALLLSLTRPLSVFGSQHR
jgi:hypothetical protein